jgi:hypothetical protein
MITKIISGFLILFSAFMGVRQGMKGLNMKPGDTGAFVDLKEKLMFSDSTLNTVAIITLLSGLLLLPPQTFLFANILNICLFVFLIIKWLLIGNVKSVLSELPFLLIPILLMFLKHPFPVK